MATIGEIEKETDFKGDSINVDIVQSIESQRGLKKTKTLVNGYKGVKIKKGQGIKKGD